MDLVPALAFHVYPLHACAFAVTACLLLGLLRAERTVDGGRSEPGPALLAIALPALILGGMRPYEPIALSVVYGFHAAWQGAIRGFPSFRIRLPIATALFLGFAPGFLYACWVSRQPIWASFARDASALASYRLPTIIGFGLLWIGAFAGGWFTRRERNAGWQFLVLWVAFSICLALGFNTGKLKLLSGSYLAAALLAAAAFEKCWRGSRASSGGRGLVWRGSLLTVLALGAVTPLDVYRSFHANVPRVDSELLAIGEAIRQRSSRTSPNILAEPEAGAVMAGLLGFHTYLGHWSLTPSFTERLSQLPPAGLMAGAALPDDASKRLQRLLIDSRTEFVILRRSAPAELLLQNDPNADRVTELDRWSCFQIRSR